MITLAGDEGPLLVGPLLRHVDSTSATIWVETRDAAEVEIRAFGISERARTFAVHGHHYALIEVGNLAPGTHHRYEVVVDGVVCWPPVDSELPQSRIPTLRPGKPLRLAFGSCRTSVAHDADGHASHGVDALRSYALRMAGKAAPHPDSVGDDDVEEPRWPDLVVFLGDQVYADETTEEMREFIASRRDIEQPPGPELKDYEEYAHLYRLAWTDPINRWLLSTVPTAMIFDDHDVRDDWNTSWTWRQQMEQTPWWHGRIVAGLASYWVYQHLGNLSAADRAEDEIWQRVVAHEGPEELDLTEVLDRFADRVDQHPETYRWGYCRDFDTQARLVVIDSRAARDLGPDRRALLDQTELDWLNSQLEGGFEHLLIGTSLPFMLARGLHHLEAFGEAVAGGAWGGHAAAAGEKLRQAVDLEHWAAFQDTFHAVGKMVTEVASGARGPAPSSVTFLSGDVHHSYVSEARPGRGSALPPLRSRLVQAVCSPIRNPLSPRMRFATAVLSYGVAGPVGRLASLSTKVPDSPLTWRYRRGPWFDNNVATLELRGRGLRMWWLSGVVVDGDHERPRLRKVADYELEA